MERRLAVIDCGSNSFRLVVFTYTDSWWKRTDEIHESVRIGEGLDASGELGEEPMERALETMRVYARDVADFLRAVGLPNDLRRGFFEFEDHQLQLIKSLLARQRGILLVAGHYGVPMKHVLAIGDAANDVPMLQAAGIGVAMDNAHDAVKSVADWVAPSNNDHGVHAALVRYGLCT